MDLIQINTCRWTRIGRKRLETIETIVYAEEDQHNNGADNVRRRAEESNGVEARER